MFSIKAALCAATVAATTTLATTAIAAPSACKFAKLGELPLKLKNNRPYIEGALNGQKMLFLADTGAFATILFAGTAKRLALPPVGAGELSTYGVGGGGTVRYVGVREMRLGDFNVPTKFLLVDNGPGFDSEVAGVIGRDIFGQLDVEFDFAAEKIRLFKAEKCGAEVSLAYWSPTPAGGPMVGVQERGGAFAINVKLNGRSVPAMLDSGASVSVVSTAAAANAGVGLKVAAAAGRMGGFSGRGVDAYTATFATLEVGGEVVKNAKLHLADMFAASREVETGSHLASEPVQAPRMILGADFLRAHRVLIANSQRRLYFTYNGGPIFRLPTSQEQAESSPAKAARASDAKSP